MKLIRRPRRLRRTSFIRSIVSETTLEPRHLIWPVFICEGNNKKEKIESLPGVFRFSFDLLKKEIKSAMELGIQGVALFPKIETAKKTKRAEEAFHSKNLNNRSIRALKDEYPDLCLFGDVALDPYTSHGHDGLVDGEEILNDETVQVLQQMALEQARAGVDFVAPSDMMDGRVQAIRQTLDHHGFEKTGILAYSAKYASAFYGPFREALATKLSFGDKRTYQMDPGNRREAVLEARLDYEEGADILMVKPGLAYLDIIAEFKKRFPIPIAAYNVSGEYAMLKAAAMNGWIDEERAILETLTSFRRAGADLILTYHAVEAARLMQK